MSLAGPEKRLGPLFVVNNANYNYNYNYRPYYDIEQQRTRTEKWPTGKRQPLARDNYAIGKFLFFFFTNYTYNYNYRP
jgi:hypothetical protein